MCNIWRDVGVSLSPVVWEKMVLSGLHLPSFDAVEVAETRESQGHYGIWFLGYLYHNGKLWDMIPIPGIWFLGYYGLFGIYTIARVHEIAWRSSKECRRSPPPEKSPWATPEKEVETRSSCFGHGGDIIFPEKYGTVLGGSSHLVSGLQPWL